MLNQNSFLISLLSSLFFLVGGALGTSSLSKTRSPEHLSQLRELARDVINSTHSGHDAESEASQEWLSRR